MTMGPMTCSNGSSGGSISWQPPSHQRSYLTFSELFLRTERERRKNELRMRIEVNAKRWSTLHAAQAQAQVKAAAEAKSAAPTEGRPEIVQGHVFPPTSNEHPARRHGENDAIDVCCWPRSSSSSSMMTTGALDQMPAAPKPMTISRDNDRLAMQSIGVIDAACAGRWACEEPASWLDSITDEGQVDKREEEHHRKSNDSDDQELDAVVNGQLYFRTRKRFPSRTPTSASACTSASAPTRPQPHVLQSQQSCHAHHGSPYLAPSGSPLNASSCSFSRYNSYSTVESCASSSSKSSRRSSGSKASSTATSLPDSDSFVCVSPVERAKEIHDSALAFQ
ncbi:hypothetical protein K437DRAFT_262316 [Tilletiaria anomala UBC 951]|uniref:Uncharacterized protein n=1 Tax=Tilletiaria anomala (strain ATCC 24038 / CBS 436.72 / UBC 951) TaxID=1037660 RepID=A0A066W3B4_TILAU|nr:uncharacterized protein K437DRAFT_262316 [Tilletiaria anomala UBC 951]KDN48216.1 hypothetical protein K437DRAFT_262316 [Tilletiaria anomala UBC 951]